MIVRLKTKSFWEKSTSEKVIYWETKVTTFIDIVFCKFLLGFILILLQYLSGSKWALGQESSVQEDSCTIN